MKLILYYQNHQTVYKKTFVMGVNNRSTEMSTTGVIKIKVLPFSPGLSLISMFWFNHFFYKRPCKALFMKNILVFRIIIFCFNQNIVIPLIIGRLPERPRAYQLKKLQQY